MRLAAIALACGTLLAPASASAGPVGEEAGDWTRFGYGSARSNACPDETGLNSSNVGMLARAAVHLQGTVDSSPLYVHGAGIGGAARDMFIAQTTCGIVYAIDADVASLPVGRGHWNTPVVTDGRIALGQEDANAHVTFGVLNIYRLP